MPKKLYKYRKFNTSTLRLLSQAEAYYADPEVFNDLLDCRPVIRVDTDVPTLEKVCYRMLVRARLTSVHSPGRSTLAHRCRRLVDSVPQL